jgi:hypothetical protein
MTDMPKTRESRERLEIRLMPAPAGIEPAMVRARGITHGALVYGMRSAPVDTTAGCRDQACGPGHPNRLLLYFDNQRGVEGNHAAQADAVDTGGRGS